MVIFRAHSDIEASVVRGLLEAHGVPSATASDVPHSVFPLTVSALSEVRISVNAGDADAARRIIESHRTALPEGSWSGCATNSTSCSRRSATASATSACSSTR